MRNIVRTDIWAAVTDAVCSELGRAASNAGVRSYAQAAKKTSCPALNVSCSSKGPAREQLDKALSSVLRYKETRYTPAAIKKLPRSKTRMEFKTEAQRKDALRRIKEAPSSLRIAAEIEKKLPRSLSLRSSLRSCPVKKLCLPYWHRTRSSRAAQRGTSPSGSTEETETPNCTI